MPANLTADALLYLWTAPGTADLGYVTPEEFGHRIGATKDLPENIRRILVGQSSADRIQALVIRKHRLTVDQAQTVARTIGRVLRGEESPVNFRSLLTKEIEAAPDVVDDIVQVLTAEFITPNYFQINQVYEKKHKTTGSRELGIRSKEPHFAEASRDGQGVGTTGETPGTPTPPAAPSRAALAPPTRPASPNVVDLRNGSIPSRLPPSPPRVAPAPAGAEWGPPLAPNGLKTSQALRPRTPTAPGPAAPAFFPAPKPPAPALPASAKPPSPEPANNSVPPPASPPAPRIQGTPLDHITPSDRPLVPIPSPRPATPRPSPPASSPPGGTTHGPLPPPASR